MTYNHGILRAGLNKPLRLFHLTDMHLTAVSEADDEYARRQQGDRRWVFRRPWQCPSEELFDAYLRQSESADLLVMTGDIIDAPSQGNLRLLREKLAGRNYLYVAGNHDWVFPRDEPPGQDVRDRNFPLLEQAVGQPQDFCVRRVGGLMLVGFDNSQYQVSREQSRRIFAELDRGEPTLLCCHVPLYIPTLVRSTVNYWHAPILMGSPDTELEGKSFGENTLRPSEVTSEFLRRLRSYPNLKGILAGHIHYNHEDLFTPTVPQIVTQCAAHAPILSRDGVEVPHSPGNARWIDVL